MQEAEAADFARLENKTTHAPWRTVSGVTVRQITAFDCSCRYQAAISVKRSTISISPAQALQETVTPPAAIALPVKLTFCRRITSPLKSNRKTRRIIDSLLDIELPFAVEQCVTATVENRMEDAADIMVTGCKKNDLAAFLKYTKNIDPVIIDHQGLALWTGSLHEIPPQKESITRLVIWLDAENTCVAVGQGTVFIDAHPLRGDPVEAFNRLVRHYTDKLENDWEAVIAGEIADTGMWEAIIKERGGRCVMPHQPQSLLARSVARRALYEGAYRCNIHPAPETHVWVKNGLRKNDFIRGGTAALIALAIGTGSICIQSRITEMEKQVSNRLTQLADETAGFNVSARGQHRIEVVRRAVAERRNQMQPLEYVSSPPVSPWLNLLYQKADSAGLRFSEISIAPYRIRISGQSPSRNATESLRQALLNDGWRISLNDYQSLDNINTFTVEAQKP